jgi:protein TonB
MLQYSKLNQRLADATDEPASSCLKSYAVYQGCKAGEKPKKCGKAPRCTAVAPVPPQMDLDGIRFVFPAGPDVTVLVPRPPRPAVDMPKIKMILESNAPTLAPNVADSKPGGGGVSGGGAVAATPTSEGSPTGLAHVSGPVAEGIRTSFVQPKYPPIAKIAQMSGTVVLRAIISRTGTIEILEVAAASNPLFVMSSIDAVRRWVYKPYMLNGEPTRVDTTITVNFLLGDPSKNPPVAKGSSQNAPQ